MQLPALARSQEAYDRFSAATNLPLTLLAVLWLPLLVLPLVMHLPAGVVRAFNVADLVIWALCCGRCGPSACCACSAWPGPASSSSTRSGASGASSPIVACISS